MTVEALGRRQDSLLAERTAAAARFFPAEAERIARVCHQMAERFARGGRLVALGHSPSERSDVRHVAVEFVHPVIVGKRALPAIGLAGEGGSLPGQAELVCEPDDLAMAFGAHPETVEALRVATERGCLTIGFAPVGAEWTFEPPSEDQFVRQELVETLYHVLWELEHDLDPVLDDVRRSVVMKAEEVSALREQTLTEGRETLVAAARALRSSFDAGGKLLALGNGGSATD